MVDVDTGRFTVGVFQDVAWAQKGIEALKQAGLPVESMTILAKESPETRALIERTFGLPGEPIELPGTGGAIARGPLVAALQGTTRDFGKLGLSGAMRRVGFQAHDGRIFEALTARGGVLVAIHSEPRAADALAILHSYGWRQRRHWRLDRTGVTARRSPRLTLLLPSEDNPVHSLGQSVYK